MITRDQAIAEYIDALGGNTGQQAAALIMLCDRIHHLGWLEGFRVCSQQHARINDVLFGKVLQDGHGNDISHLVKETGNERA